MKYELPVNMPEMVNQLQRDLIQQALEQTKGNTTQAAKLLGVKRPTLIYKMKILGVATDETAPE